MERGKGLRALIPTGTLAEPETETVREVPVEQVSPNPFQPRKQWNEEELADLVESVKTHGILQPLVVRRRGETLELVAGERRLTAARQAGLTRVPVIFREATDQEMLELALVENLQRANLNAAEAAEAYHRLIAEFQLTQEQVAQRVGKSRSAVANAVRLLGLPPQVLESIRNHEIDAGHGRALLALEGAAAQLRAWRKVIRRGLSVRQTEALAAKRSGSVSRETPAGERGPALDPNLYEVQEQLTRRLSTKVRLRPGKGKSGVIEIEYADGEELDRLYWEMTRG